MSSLLALWGSKAKPSAGTSSGDSNSIIDLAGDEPSSHSQPVTCCPLCSTQLTIAQVEDHPSRCAGRSRIAHGNGHKRHPPSASSTQPPQSSTPSSVTSSASSPSTELKLFGPLRPSTARDAQGPSKRRKGLDLPPTPFEYLAVIDLEWTCRKGPMLPCAEVTEFSTVLLCVDTKTRRVKVVDELQVYCRPIFNPVLSEFAKELTGITQEQVDQGSSLAEALKRTGRWLRDHTSADSKDVGMSLDWTGEAEPGTSGGEASDVHSQTNNKLVSTGQSSCSNQSASQPRRDCSQRAPASSASPPSNWEIRHNFRRVAVVTWTDADMMQTVHKECLAKNQPKPFWCANWIDLKSHFKKHFGFEARGGLRKCVERVGCSWHGRAHSGLVDAANTAKIVALMVEQGFKFTRFTRGCDEDGQPFGKGSRAMQPRR
jgi:inhibitor of KinA sporulation pathway (predicted exonuclease)